MTLETVRLENVKKIFHTAIGKLIVLDEISYLFSKGKSYAITGASGVGKSTLLHILSGLESPTSGNLYCNDHHYELLHDTEKRTLRTQSLGIAFQSPYLIDECSVLENVAIKGLLAHYTFTKAKQYAQWWLEKVDLADVIHEFPYNLSRGQQQRVALARALMLEPDFLIADEPTSNVDKSTASIIIDLLLERVSFNKMGLIISTHDTVIAARCHEIISLYQGKIQIIPPTI